MWVGVFASRQNSILVPAHCFTWKHFSEFLFFAPLRFNNSRAFSAYLSILHSDTERKRERRKPGHVISYLSHGIYGLRFSSVMVVTLWWISNIGRRDFKGGLGWIG